MPPALDEPALLPPPAAAPEPVAAAPDTPDPLQAQFDLGWRAASDVMVESVLTWSRFSRAYMEAAEVSRRAFGELLLDWHQRLRGPTAR